MIYFFNILILKYKIISYIEILIIYNIEKIEYYNNKFYIKVFILNIIFIFKYFNKN